MKKACFSVLVTLFIFLPAPWAEGNPPVLRSNEKVIGFEAGTYLKTNWQLQPELNPDVFTLPEYRVKQRVTFTAGTNSLSFVARPGQTYDLLVLLGNGDRCRITIVALPTPALLRGSSGIIVGLGISFLALVAYVKRRAIRPAVLLSCGLTAPLSFWTLAVIGGLVHGHYNHLTMVVSELGATGTQSELLMSIGEVLVAVQCVLFSVGLLKACEERKLSVIPALCTLGLPISVVWAAVFPMRHELHGVLGPLPLLLNAGALLAFMFWRSPEISRLRWLSLVSFGMMGLIFLRFIPGIQASYPGLVQRLYYVGWSVWSVCLAAGFLRIATCRVSGQQQSD